LVYNKSKVVMNGMAKNALQAGPQAAELAKVFVRDAEKTAGILEAIFNRRNSPQDDDLTNYTVNIHLLKTALANIGEHSLSARALEMEQAARVRDLAVVAEKTAPFLADLRALTERVRPVEEEYGAELTEDEGDYLRGKWQVIQTACLTYDKKNAKDTLNELKTKLWPRAVKEALDAVSAHLLHSDFEEAAAIAEREMRGG
jgi:HPt (histidine-containing phosphotransfer) domain-containing protein